MMGLHGADTAVANMKYIRPLLNLKKAPIVTFAKKNVSCVGVCLSKIS